MSTVTHVGVAHTSLSGWCLVLMVNTLLAAGRLRSCSPAVPAVVRAALGWCWAGGLSGSANNDVAQAYVGCSLMPAPR